jgi:probable phosphoglycerate mutase
VLLRHGRTAWNDSGRAQGHADVGLDEVGHAQAADVASYLAAMGPVALWTSDLARARQTCSYVERATGLEPKVDERLREFDVGDRRGMTSAEFQQAFPAAYADWVAGAETHRVPGAELASEVASRIVPALRECLGSLAAGETGVVVTHGAALKVGVVGLLGWPAAQTADLRGIDNCGWVNLVAGPGAGDRPRLAGYNLRAGRSGGGVTDL